MKKKIVCVVAALIIGVVTVLNVKTVLDANRSYDLAMTSIDALSENGNGESGGDSESNDQGSGKFYYKHLEGSPKFCTLYRNVHVSGKIEYTNKEGSLGAGWVSSKVEGLKDNCPNRGEGCTAYSCQTTN